MAYDVDDYDPSTALTAYYPTRTGRVPARIWAVEKLAHDLAELGIIEMFEGAGTNPTSLTGYAADKMWLQVQSGVTEEPGVLRLYDGVGSASDIANWPAVTVDSFRSYLSFGQVEYAGVWNATTNSPALVSGGGVAGNYYVVSVAGTTTLDAVSSRSVGEWAIFNGTAWQKVEMSADRPMQAADGSAAEPSFYFISDPDTGFYRAGANEIGVAVGGVSLGTFAAGGGGKFDSFPTGTVMIFAQTAAPTGWTKSVAHDNKALRVVSGAASSGGSTAFTSVFAARTIAQANLPNVNFTGTAASDGAHTHTYDKAAAIGAGGAAGSGIYATFNTVNTGSSGAHTHTVSVASGGSGTALDFAVQYVDVILATRN